MGTIKRSVVAARSKGGERWRGRAHNIFTAVKILCMILQWWVYIIIYLSKHKDNAKSEPSGTLWILGDYDVLM